MADVLEETTKLNIIERLRQLTLKTDVRELFEEAKLPFPGEIEEMRQYLVTLTTSAKQEKDS
ncbi:MAG: hypothetical protein ACOYW4_08595 [Bacillota bacterium]